MLLLLIEELRNQIIVSSICMEWVLIFFKEACSSIIYLIILHFAALILVEVEKVKENIALLGSSSIGISVTFSLPRLYNNSSKEIRIQEVHFMGKINGSFCQFSLFFNSFIQQFLRFTNS